jgi:hypothetical protein
MSTSTGKGKKRKRIGKLRDPAQSDRFIKEAEKMGLGGSRRDFDRAMDKLFGKPPKRGNS